MPTALIATQDHVLGSTLAAELDGLGVDTQWVATGMEALEAAGGAGMVFLDVNLPIFNGFDVAARLRDDPDIPPALPIIMLTGRDTAHQAQEAPGTLLQLNKTHAAQEVRELVSRALFGA